MTDGEITDIEFRDMRFRTKRPDGEFMDCEKALSGAMNREKQLQFGANVDYLIDALKSLKASGATTQKPVIFEFRGETEAMIFRTDADNAKMVLPVRLQAKEVT